MKFYINITKFTLIIFMFFGCGENKCNKDSLFEISPDLISVANSMNYEYCELINESVNLNMKSIVELSLLDFQGGYGYKHGAVLINLVDKIGENRYLQALSKMKLDNKKKKKIFFYFLAGFDIKNHHLHPKKYFKKRFPKVYDFLS